MTDKIIKVLISGDNEENGTIYRLGRTNIIEITEHSACKDGDKWFYDVHYEDGGVLRIFNPLNVVFEPEEKTKES